jgi:hypothetical protein
MLVKAGPAGVEQAEIANLVQTVAAAVKQGTAAVA